MAELLLDQPWPTELAGVPADLSVTLTNRGDAPAYFVGLAQTGFARRHEDRGPVFFPPSR